MALHWLWVFVALQCNLSLLSYKHQIRQTMVYPRTTTSSSAFVAALFAVMLLLGGCASSLTGPQADTAPSKPVYEVDGQIGQEAGRNGGEGGTTSTGGASRNSADT